MSDTLENAPQINPPPESKEDASKKPSWKKVDSELKAALGSWQVLTEQMADKISPDEEQLTEVKRLLSELKDKLKDFT